MTSLASQATACPVSTTGKNTRTEMKLNPHNALQANRNVMNNGINTELLFVSFKFFFLVSL